VGLRYFNVYGARQDPRGEYAAVVPRWIETMVRGEPCVVYGDGATTRDFVHVSDVVTANLQAATAPDDAVGGVYNVASGVETSLNELYDAMLHAFNTLRPGLDIQPPHYEAFREGEVRRSWASLEAATSRISYEPRMDLATGLAETIPWYLEKSGAGR
jgi:UDP-N-acetylglucosamine 4-epimerase